MIYLFILILSLPSLTWAAIDCNDPGSVEFYDATPLDPETGAGNYTPPSATNTITFLGVGHRRGGGSTTMTPTIGGNAMTPVAGAIQYQDPAAAQLYWVTGLAVSAQAISVDFGVLPLADGIIVWSCTGVDTSSPIRSFDGTAGSSTTASSTPGTVQAGDVVVDFVFKDGLADFTVGANQNVIQQGSDGAETAAGASWQLGSDGAAMTWSLASEQWASVSAVIKPLSTRRAIAPVIMK